ncbi:MAG: protein phosphatase 2C domain-containing protein, partial [Gemmatimonadetes bacterium]|nr:protein phosphatase 2C domain-containing protein [Gemmatimonadota bacterium]
LAEAAAYACDALRTIARAGGGEPRDVRTTLLAAVLWGDGTDARLAVTQVGDGAILVRTHDGGVQQLGAGDAGDYSGEVTCFVPDDEAPARARAALVERAAHDVTHVLLLTDGIEDPFYPLARRGGTLFAQLLAGVESPAEHFQRQAVHGPVFGDAAACARLGAWLAFERRGENDDRTIVAAIRVGAR